MGLFVDNFAGGGGASLGIKLATGREVDIAINHDQDAVDMHRENHPHSKHLCEDVWQADPVALCAGEEVDLAWFSPDCKHFSRAKGSKPVEKKIRGLAWVAIKWARAVRPKLIVIENVREFQDWGPLIPKRDERGRQVRDEEGNPLLVPDPERKGITFRRFVGNLRALGYAVEWRELNASDYGAPTHRRRLFLIARCDDQPIAWPEPSHGPGRKPWRTAAECIDWSLPCPSIFERKRPLKEKTLQRIARGLKRFVIECAEPFIVTCNHGDKGFRGQSVHEPMRTITAARDAHGIVTPYVVRYNTDNRGENRSQGIGTPLTTVDTQNRFGVVTPFLVRPAHGEGKKGKKRGAAEHSVREPLGTVLASNEHALTLPMLQQVGHWDDKHDGRDLNQPLNTIMGKEHHLLCAAFLAKHFGGVTGVRVDKPLPTITARGTQTQLVAAAFISNQNRADNGTGMHEPLRTICANNHAAEVRAFLIKYYGAGTGQTLNEPIHTITAQDRFGLVTIAGVDYQIVDIGMRMLSPRELARAQGFPDSYKLTGTKTNQVARIGNSVCPPIAAAIVRANFKRPARKAVA